MLGQCSSLAELNLCNKRMGDERAGRLAGLCGGVWSRRCNGFAAHCGKIEDRDEGRSLAAAEFQYKHSNSSNIKAGHAKHVKKQTQTHTRSG